MKKLFICLLLTWPLLAVAQQPIPENVIAGFDKYVQFTEVSGKLVTRGHFTTVSSDPNKVHEIFKDDGKPFIFQSESQVLIYMDKQGFDFFSFSPIWPKEEEIAKIGGITYHRKIIFKKRGS